MTTLREFRVRNNAVDYFNVDASGNTYTQGNAGIGITPQSFSKLQVKTATDRNVTVFDNAVGATIGGLTDAGASASLRLAGSPLIMTGGGGAGAEHMHIDSSGRVTMPYQPMFSGNRSGKSYIANINANVDFTPIVNQGNHWNTSTNTFTCPVAGKYFVSFFNLTYTGLNTSASQIDIRRNNSTVYTAYADAPSGSNYNNHGASGVLDCAANDTITFFSQSGVVYSDAYCGATVYLIG
jgi:hypothetical protein